MPTLLAEQPPASGLRTCSASAGQPRDEVSERRELSTPTNSSRTHVPPNPGASATRLRRATSRNYREDRSRKAVYDGFLVFGELGQSICMLYHALTHKSEVGPPP